MTAAGTFRACEVPILFADLLISGPNTNPNLTIPSQLGTQDGRLPVEPHEVSGRLAELMKPVDLAQKVVIISPRLCVCWAGRVDLAMLFVNYLRNRAASPMLTRDELTAVLRAYSFDCNIEMNFALFLYDGVNLTWANSDGWPTPYDIGHFRQVRLFGTGREVLFESVMAASEWEPDPKLHPVRNALLNALDCVGVALGGQVFFGIGFRAEHAFGGGFEIAYFDGGRGFQKVDGLLHMFAYVDGYEDGTWRVTFMGPYFYQYYVGDELRIVLETDTQKRATIYAVPPFGTDEGRLRSRELPMSMIPKSFDIEATVISMLVRAHNQPDRSAVQTRSHSRQDAPIAVYQSEKDGTSFFFKPGFMHSFITGIGLDPAKTTVGAIGWANYKHDPPAPNIPNVDVPMPEPNRGGPEAERRNSVLFRGK